MEQATTRTRWLVIVGVVLAMVVVAIGGLGIVRKIESFQPLGFAAQANQGHWLVLRVDDPTTALAANDRIVLINGAETASLTNPADLLRSSTASELVVLRGDRLETITYRLPSLHIDFPYLVLALVGFGYLMIGFFTLIKDRRRPAWIFYLWCLTSAVLFLVSPTSLSEFAGRLLFFGDQLARVLLPPLTLHLFLVFPRPLSDSRWLRRLVPFLYLPAAFLLLLQADLILSGGAWLFGGSTAAGVQTMDRLELLLIALYTLLAIVALIRRWLYTDDLEQRRQVAWVTIGLAGGYLPFLAIYVLPAVAGVRWPQLVNTLAVLPLAVVPITFAYAILRYKLWDIGVVVRDTLSLTFTILIGIFGFALANTVVSRVVPTDLAVARNLLTFVTGLVIAGVLIPTRRQIGSSLQHIQYGSRYTKRRALLEFGRELMEESSLDTLCGTLRRQLEEGLDLVQAGIFLVSGSGLAPSCGDADMEPLPVTSFGYDFWERDVESLSGFVLAESEITWQQQLYSRGYRYAFPMTVRDRPVGFVVTGYKLDETPLSSDDTDLIRSLLNQAALGIENARLLSQVQNQLDEVVRLKEFNQSIIESSPAGIAVIDAEGAVVRCNASLVALLDRSTADLDGHRLLDLLPLDSLPDPGGSMVEASYTDTSDNERYVQVSVAGLSDHNDDGHHVVVVQDVSERREMENTLKERERLAALGMLAAGVAHEVNTPITGISSYAQMLLADTPEDDPRHKLLRKVEQQTFRAARIVNNLLDFAREGGDERRPLNLVSLITECLELLSERLADQQIRLHWDTGADPVVIEGHEGELHQVFTNLIVNAIDAMPEEGGELKVAVEATDAWVFAYVEDNGVGIPQQQLAKIFQPFYSTKLSRGGTGLGLSISYNIVRQHRGEIRVVSNPDSGTRFVVELPAHRASAARADEGS